MKSLRLLVRHVEWVRSNVGVVTIAIIAISLMPFAIEFVKHRLRASGRA